jgi:hypothetical protein
MTTKNKKIIIGIGSLLFGLTYCSIQNDFKYIDIIVYSLCPILLSLILMIIYTILVSLFEKKYKIEFVNTFFTFWIWTIVLSIVGIYGSIM